MNILHISDTHGAPLRDLETWGDVVVHSGDMLPNSGGNRREEENFQRGWIRRKAGTIAVAVGSRPLVYIPGNHDYYDPTNELVEVGIDLHYLCNESLTLDGVGFYGHPWTPQFGYWNWMASEAELSNKLFVGQVDLMLLNSNIDVFVSHGPMRGVLDRTYGGVNAGSTALKHFFDEFGVAKVLLHGHIHEAAGEDVYRGMRISNAAQTQRRIVL